MVYQAANGRNSLGIAYALRQSTWEGRTQVTAVQPSWAVCTPWLAVLMLVSTIAAQADARHDCPNIVVMLADDLGFGDLACYGHPQIRSPNIDRLAAEGLKFTACYAAAPMCSPSRAGLLTGRSPHRTGVFDWIAHDGSSSIHLRPSEVTFANMLQAAGYQTALHGKWHLNSKFNSKQQPQPDDHGFDYWFATQFSPSHLNPTGFVRNGKALPTQQGYSCQIVVDDAVAWLKNREDNNKPFLQFLSFHEPHHPVASPPSLVAEHLGNSTNVRNEAIYFANIENLDRAVGRYLLSLKQLGLAESTLVVFTSDHGPQTLGRGVFQHSYGQTGGLRGRKRHLWEGGIRVPAIVRWSDKITPREESAPIGFVDFLPTFASLAACLVPSDRTIDGADVSPLLAGRPVRRITPLHWHFYSPLSGPQSVLREGRWCVTARWDVGAKPFRQGTRHIPEFQHLIRRSQLTDFALYDVVADPAQTNDVTRDHTETAERLAKVLRRLHREVCDEAPVWSTTTNTSPAL